MAISSDSDPFHAQKTDNAEEDHAKGREEEQQTDWITLAMHLFRIHFVPLTLVEGRSTRQQLLHRHAAQIEQPPNRVLDQVVRARRAGGDADGDVARGQPVARLDFFLAVP